MKTFIITLAFLVSWTMASTYSGLALNPNSGVIHSFDIDTDPNNNGAPDPNNVFTTTCEYELSNGLGQWGIDMVEIPAPGDSSWIALTRELTGSIVIFDPTTAQVVVSVSVPGATDLAGIAYNPETNVVYSSGRYTSELYAYVWNPADMSLTPYFSGDPYKALDVVTSSFAIKVVEDELWITESTLPSQVKIFDLEGNYLRPFPSSPLPLMAIGIEVDPVNRYAYFGSPVDYGQGVDRLYRVHMDTEAVSFVTIPIGAVADIAIQDEFVMITTMTEQGIGDTDRVFLYTKDLEFVGYSHFAGDLSSALFTQNAYKPPSYNTTFEAGPSEERCYDSNEPVTLEYSFLYAPDPNESGDFQLSVSLGGVQYISSDGEYEAETNSVLWNLNLIPFQTKAVSLVVDPDYSVFPGASITLYGKLTSNNSADLVPVTIDICSGTSTTVYVTETGGGVGTHWGSPTTLSNALALAEVLGPSQLFITAGEHHLFATANLHAIELYGGFAGTETTKDDRVGDLGRSQIVHYGSYGNMFSSDNQGHLIVDSIEFSNAAEYVFDIYFTPTQITNCAFVNNDRGVNVASYSSVELEGCVFANNTYVDITNTASGISISKCTFINSKTSYASLDGAGTISNSTWSTYDTAVDLRDSSVEASDSQFLSDGSGQTFVTSHSFLDLNHVAVENCNEGLSGDQNSNILTSNTWFIGVGKNTIQRCLQIRLEKMLLSGMEAGLEMTQNAGVARLNNITARGCNSGIKITGQTARPQVRGSVFAFNARDVECENINNIDIQNSHIDYPGLNNETFFNARMDNKGFTKPNTPAYAKGAVKSLNPTSAGDLDFDRKVGMSDFAILAGEWMQVYSDPNDPLRNLNSDSDPEINMIDLAMFTESWAEQLPPIDYDGNGRLDMADFAVISARWKTFWPEGDLNGDLIFDELDLAIFMEEWLLYAEGPAPIL